MQDDKFSVASALLMAQWERAKGELRAVVVIKGSYHSGGSQTSTYESYEELDALVENFIRAIEDGGLTE